MTPWLGTPSVSGEDIGVRAVQMMVFRGGIGGDQGELRETTGPACARGAPDGYGLFDLGKRRVRLLRR